MKEDQEKVFDRFFQSSNGQQLGTGIGLALTKQLVEFHHGKCQLKSKPGEGSTFIVEIPVDKADPSEKLTIPTDREIHHQDNLLIEDDPEMPDNAEGPVILIIEDDPDLRDYLSTLLLDNYTIHKGNTGVEGIAKAKEIIPDLIISDVMMPEKDGMEVCEELKQPLRRSHTHYLLTARADQESKLRGLTTGRRRLFIKTLRPKRT